ncbi:MAG: TerC family protein [Hyphomicrobiaceae bacterium]|nr:TerC family protein [Hyphomicrobiaceae bacterium]
MTALLTAGGGFSLADFFSSHSGVIGQILKIVWIDLILSGDNAVLIALACRSLPDRRQRRAGIILGAAVAIILRIVFAGTVTHLLDIPYLKLIGGVLLFWIAVKLLIGEDEDEPNITAHDRLWRAVGTIALADVLMSLDNVIAVAAVAKGSVWLIAFGVALSIPLIIWGSSLVLAMIARFPVIIWLGAALLGWIAGELIASEIQLRETMHAIARSIGISTPALHHVVALTFVVLTLLVGWFIMRRAKRAKVAVKNENAAT